ncbi:DUF3256 family protein [Prevotella sp. KH2C16]|uniref:DUF3256 family protein n=1 Tax=Prevotella sp. KH2C16 TaxID=1855325 RepID=UPI000B84E864|nr:DUF3256 family protein [Prevotella sp. KH2C16]
MKRLLILFLLSLSMMSLSAKSVREMWLSMPDSIIPYLNNNQRIELVDFVNLNVKSEVNNLLGDSTVLDTLSIDYLHLTVNPSVRIELKMLPFTNADSILCMIKTLNGPEFESIIDFYDKDWKRLPSDAMFDGVGLTGLRDNFAFIPDTLSKKRQAGFEGVLDPVLMYASLNPTTNEIIFSLSLPLMSEREKQSIREIFLPKKFKWTGKVFKSVMI